MGIKLGQDIIDVLRGKTRTKLHYKIEDITRELGFKNKLKNLKEKVKRGEKIRVGFYTVLDSFTSESVFKYMCKSDIFEPFILVIPDVTRGEEHMWRLYNNTLNSFKEYENVISSYDFDKKEFVDYKGNADIIFFANPYDWMTHEFYRIKNNPDSLNIFVPYAFFVTNHIETFIKAVDSLKYFWKIFLESAETQQYYKKLSKLKNTCLTGFPRVDKLYNAPVDNKRQRKRVFVAIHSVAKKNTDGIEFAQFLHFDKILLNLPEMYPNIDFVYRPHPFLFTYLKNEQIWTQEQIDDYVNKLKNYPNVTYQASGDFSYDFVNSDGIIQDCASFLPEYLITGHPTCYMQTSREIYEKYFTPLGQKCLDHCYIADKEKSITDYIENVIINGNDTMKDARLEFVENNLKLNYGKISETITNYIKNEIKAQKIVNIKAGKTLTHTGSQLGGGGRKPLVSSVSTLPLAA